MAVTIEQLAEALRIGAVDAEVTAILNRQQAAAQAIIGRIAPDAPEAVVDEAVVRFVGWSYDNDPASNRGYAHAMRHCGAMGLLQPWLPRGGVVVGDVEDVPVSTGGGLSRSEVRALIADWAETGNVERIPTSKAPMPATNAEADAGTSTTIRSWTAALIRRVVEAIVPAWVRGASGRIPFDRLADGTAELGAVPALGSEGGMLVLQWAHLSGRFIGVVAALPGDSVGQDGAHVIISTNPPSLAVKDSGTWGIVYTWPAAAGIDADGLAMLLESFAGAGPGEVLTLDGQGENPSWQPSQGGVTIQQVNQAIATHAADDDAHQPVSEEWANEGNSDVIPPAKLPAAITPRTNAEIQTQVAGMVNRGDGLANDGVGDQRELNLDTEHVQDLVGAMFDGNANVAYDDAGGVVTITFPEGGDGAENYCVLRRVGSRVGLWRIGRRTSSGAQVFDAGAGGWLSSDNTFRVSTRAFGHGRQ